MAQDSKNLVGDSFRLGNRRQIYWGRSMAIAFFCAEVGAGTFLVSMFYDFLPGMIVGLVMTGILKPYFHLTHMGVPLKAWRAFARQDRSWVSRGALSIVVFVGLGLLYVLHGRLGIEVSPQLTTVLKGVVVAAGIVVASYQGLAMAASPSITLWSTPFVPVASLCYAATGGTLTVLALGSLTGALDPAAMPGLTRAAALLLALDFVVVRALLAHARAKSEGGAFSVALLVSGALAERFRNLVILIGLVAPLLLLVGTEVVGAAQKPLLAVALISMLVGFYAFRVLLFRAAVFEPITHDLAGSIGLPR
ncbi:MAG: dimethyl sulfoxide reductase anchor subunit [Alphaproteobacteria bacterium]|nr:dimethyl sulfoxide reductase anchor subunit [Alphaproteobacteria bacterium]